MMYFGLIYLILNILGTLLLFVLRVYISQNFYLRQRIPLIVILNSICIICFNIASNIEFIFPSFLSYLFIFIMKNIGMGIPCFIYSYRGLIMYFNYKKNYNKLLNQDYIEPIIIYRSFVFIFILYKLYIISIIILYYKKEFDENSWQYIPLHVLFFIYLFISYPSIIYLLYKINEGDVIKEYIFCFISLSIAFILNIINIYIFNNMTINLIQTTINFIVHSICCVYPLFYSIKYKPKKNRKIKEIFYFKDDIVNERNIIMKILL